MNKIPYDLYVDDNFVRRYYYDCPCYNNKNFLTDGPYRETYGGSKDNYILVGREWIIDNVIKDGSIKKDQIMTVTLRHTPMGVSNGSSWLNRSIICSNDNDNKIFAISLNSVKRDSKGHADKIPWDLYIDDVFVKRYYYNSPCYQGGPYGSMRVEEEFVPDDPIIEDDHHVDHEPKGYIEFTREWIMQNIITDNAIQKDKITRAIVNNTALDFPDDTSNYYCNPSIFCKYTDKPNEIRATSKK